MKKKILKCKTVDSDMLPEYDFKGGIRGKHYKAYRQGHTVTVHKADGGTVVQHFTLEEGAVMLEPNVRKYFATSKVVNEVLGSIIQLVPRKPHKGIKRIKKVG